MRIGFANKMEDQFWHRTLTALAGFLGTSTSKVEQKDTLVDPRLQWKYNRNIWNNAAIRSTLYTMATPIRWFQQLFNRDKRSD
jgi:hypothetical protein